MLRTRILTALILIPLVVGTTLLGGWWLFLLMGGGFILCGHEYFTMVRAGGYRPERALGVVLVALLLLDAMLGWRQAPLILVAAVVLPPAWEFRRTDHEGFLASWALTVLGVLYIGVLGSYLFTLRALPDGAALLGFTLMATWSSDGAAFGVGIAMGRRPFFHHISPKKTWEGAIGGVVGAAIAFGVLMSIYGFNPLLSFIGGIGVGIAATVGDLTESLIKRQVAVKDSGSLLAGHGGVLDRLDSTFFAVVFAFYFIQIVGVR
ncbi:MAG: phosphatidate cytidylyltransferase [Anaerolineae bacterium]